MGVNTPAWSVVIAGLDRPDSPYSVAEYKNMVGRAGRLGFTPKGKSFLVAASAAEEHWLWNTYVLGQPEALVSRFSDQEPLSLVCRVLATAAAAKTDGLSGQELVDFIQSTFAAHQGGNKLDSTTVFQAVERLFEARLVERIEDRYRLTDLGKVAGELGIYVESVVRIARALAGLPGDQMPDRVLLAAAQVSQELDEVLFPIHSKSVKERQRWQGAVQLQHLPASVMRELRAADDRTFTARCKRLSAVLMWLDGVELNRMEASLLQHQREENAAGPIRATAERTRDLLGVVGRIGGLVSGDQTEPRADLNELNGRLELGIPSDVMWLASSLKRGLERGDYLNLRRAGLSDIDALEGADDAALARAVQSKSKVRSIRGAIVEIRSRKPLSGDDLPMPTPAE